MGTDSFFENQTEESKLKADIVSKYFSSWANVMASQNNEMICYLDFFSGPGRYEDGNPSTPLLVLEKAINHFRPQVPQKIKFIFNDAKPKFYKTLEKEINGLPGIEKLRIPPTIKNVEVAEETVQEFKVGPHVPTLSFVDPWGYKGLSLPLVRGLVEDWGCDCIFFFNYRRINSAIDNPVLKDPVIQVFTDEILKELQGHVSGKKPSEREKIILRKMKEVFQQWGMKYVLPFAFKNESGNRTTHYLVFVSKDIKGYSIMTEIMGKCCSCDPQGVPSFEHNPALIDAPFLIPPDDPLKRLKRELRRDFQGQTITMERVYEIHQMRARPYLKRNYKKALMELEEENLILTNRAQRKKARPGTLSDEVVITFPPGIK